MRIVQMYANLWLPPKCGRVSKLAPESECRECRTGTSEGHLGLEEIPTGNHYRFRNQ